MEKEEEGLTNWYKALAEDPEYYTTTEEGQKELADMIRRESERLIEELSKSVKRTKEVIWLSRFCPSCRYYADAGRKVTCQKWQVRIVKPFQGRAVWAKVASSRSADGKELVVEGIDWDSKWREISDQVVEMAVKMVNGGFPYFCFDGR